MARCRHQNCEVQETTQGHLAWRFKDGKIVDSYVNQGDVNFGVLVICDDCGLVKYWPASKAWPLWLDAHMGKIWHPETRDT